MRLFSRALMAVGVLALPVVAASPAHATWTPARCASIASGVNYGGGAVTASPASHGFSLAVQCNALSVGRLSSARGSKNIGFLASPATDWCNGASSGSGTINGTATSGITGTFTFVKTGNHYEINGRYRRASRDFSVHVSGDLSSHSPGPCNYTWAELRGSATFQEILRPWPGVSLAFSGTTAYSPGLTPTGPNMQSVNLSGTATGVGGTTPTACSLSMSGTSSAPETLAAGGGTMSGGCGGIGIAITCLSEYERVGAVMVLSGDCDGTPEGVLSGVFALQPTNVNPTTSYALAGAIAIR